MMVKWLLSGFFAVILAISLHFLRQLPFEPKATATISKVQSQHSAACRRVSSTDPHHTRIACYLPLGQTGVTSAVNYLFYLKIIGEPVYPIRAQRGAGEDYLLELENSMLPSQFDVLVEGGPLSARIQTHLDMAGG